MSKTECVRRARSLNHQAIFHRSNGKIFTAAELRAKRNGYIFHARELA